MHVLVQLVLGACAARVATPTFTPDGGSAVTSVEITLTTATVDSQIYYTSNGSTPTNSSTLYTGSINHTVLGVTEFRAFAQADGMNASAIVARNFTLMPPAFRPTYFTPDGSAIYEGSVTVALATTVANATILYTLDGTAPLLTANASGAVRTYDGGPLTFSLGTTQLRAVTYNSSVAPTMQLGVESGANYTVLAKASAPVFSPAGGTYTTSVTITMENPNPADTQVHYTTNGQTPTASSALYSGPIQWVNEATQPGIQATTFKAVVVGTGLAASSVASQTFNVIPVVASPVFSPAGGSFTSFVDVELASATSGASVYYTVDGSLPCTSASINERLRYDVGTHHCPASRDLLYSGMDCASATPAPTPASTAGVNAPRAVYSCPIKVGAKLRLTESTVIHAFAIRQQFTDSAVTASTFTILPPSTPSLVPDGGTFANSVSVQVTSTTASAALFYTVDGSSPVFNATTVTNVSNATGNTSSYVTYSVGSSQRYTSSALSLSVGVTRVRAVAYDLDAFPYAVLGEERSATFEVLQQASTPQIFPAASTHVTSVRVTMSSSAGATIYYTSDGRAPTVASAAYAGPFDWPALGHTRFRVVAIGGGLATSAIASKEYTVLEEVQTPVFGPAGESGLSVFFRRCV
jgi:hypothetical protein